MLGIFCAASYAGNITTTPAPEKAKEGAVIKVSSDKVPSYCDFKEQIVNIGYDKKDNIIMACVKKS